MCVAVAMVLLFSFASAPGTELGSGRGDQYSDNKSLWTSRS